MLPDYPFYFFSMNDKLPSHILCLKDRPTPGHVILESNYHWFDLIVKTVILVLLLLINNSEYLCLRNIYTLLSPHVYVS